MIANALEVSQPNVSRIEQEDDVYLSTLARYVSALGGHLEVLAVFPEETITLLREPDEAGHGHPPASVADDEAGHGHPPASSADGEQAGAGGRQDD
jgi:hypothetical protein